MKSLSIAATGMLAQQRNVEVISNNIANLNTVGFKRQRAEFQDLLYQTLERAGAHKGRYHVLGGLLSPLDGVGPKDLNIGGLAARAAAASVREVVLALPATVDGQTTAHYVADQLAGADVAVTRLSQGVPIGGELDYLDEGTLAAAMKTRRPA